MVSVLLRFVQICWDLLRFVACCDCADGSLVLVPAPIHVMGIAELALAPVCTCTCTTWVDCTCICIVLAIVPVLVLQIVHKWRNSSEWFVLLWQFSCDWGWWRLALAPVCTLTEDWSRQWMQTVFMMLCLHLHVYIPSFLWNCQHNLKPWHPLQLHKSWRKCNVLARLQGRREQGRHGVVAVPTTDKSGLHMWKKCLNLPSIVFAQNRMCLALPNKKQMFIENVIYIRHSLVGCALWHCWSRVRLITLKSICTVLAIVPVLVKFLFCDEKHVMQLNSANCSFRSDLSIRHFVGCTPCRADLGGSSEYSHENVESRSWEWHFLQYHGYTRYFFWHCCVKFFLLASPRISLALFHHKNDAHYHARIVEPRSPQCWEWHFLQYHGYKRYFFWHCCVNNLFFFAR